MSSRSLSLRLMTCAIRSWRNEGSWIHWSKVVAKPIRLKLRESCYPGWRPHWKRTKHWERRCWIRWRKRMNHRRQWLSSLLRRDLDLIKSWWQVSRRCVSGRQSKWERTMQTMIACWQLRCLIKMLRLSRHWLNSRLLSPNSKRMTWRWAGTLP